MSLQVLSYLIIASLVFLLVQVSRAYIRLQRLGSFGILNMPSTIQYHLKNSPLNERLVFSVKNPSNETQAKAFIQFTMKRSDIDKVCYLVFPENIKGNEKEKSFFSELTDAFCFTEIMSEKGCENLTFTSVKLDLSKEAHRLYIVSVAVLCCGFSLDSCTKLELL